MSAEDAVSTHAAAPCSDDEKDTDPDAQRGEAFGDIFDEACDGTLERSEHSFSIKGRVFSIFIDGAPRHTGLTVKRTGEVLWGASHAMCEYLQQSPEVLADQRVIELGAGLGLVGLLAATMSRETVLTDGDSYVCELMQHNISANKNVLANASVSAHVLKWGLPLPEGYSEGFDVCLAADVVYDRRRLPGFVKTAMDLLKPRGLLILAFSHRGVGFDELVSAARGVGFTGGALPDPAPAGLFVFRRGLS